MQNLSVLEEKAVEQPAASKYKDKIITIPNILSLLRLCMIPLIVWLYIGKGDNVLAGVFVLISGLTDIVDGFIARTFNMISDLGKILDPIADRATQAVIIILLATDFPLMIMIIGCMIVKELFMAVSGYLVIKRCNKVLGAEWYGKAATVTLSAIMMLHLFWPNILPVVSTVSIILGTAMVLLALILYAKRNLGYLLTEKVKNDI